MVQTHKNRVKRRKATGEWALTKNNLEEQSAVKKAAGQGMVNAGERTNSHDTHETPAV